MIERRFLVSRELGRGSYGIVEEVLHGNRKVARKRLRDGCSRIHKYRERFSREVEIMQRLRHRNIMSILDVNLTGNAPWFTMPLAERNLERELVLTDGLPLQRIRVIFGQLLDAIEYAHGQGVLHRDLGPRNVLLIGDRVVVSDFGLGRQKGLEGQLTSRGEKGGTLGFTAPEQWADLHAASEQSDIYALGSLLYMLATGRHPMAMVANSLPAKFRHIIKRCRHDDPTSRYPTIAELRADFDDVWISEADATPPWALADALLRKQGSDTSTVRRLVELYLRHAEDGYLYRQTLPQWPDHLLTMLKDHDPEEFAEIITNFDGHVSGHLPFDYVDTASDFLARVFRLATDEELRRLVLTRILVMGKRHHRFHARRVFASIAEAAKDASDVLAVRQVLFANSTAAAWAAEELQARRIAPLIREAIQGGFQHLALPERTPTRGSTVHLAVRRHVPNQNVFHPKFGGGAVVEVIDRESDQEVVVDFHRFGRKRLLASLAALEILAS